jgi:hypothetical protein
MVKISTKDRLQAIEDRLAGIEARLDAKLDADTANQELLVDDSWMDGLDTMTKFMLEQGWVTKEEVRKNMREAGRGRP